MLEKKSLLITGGTGSFGKAVLKNLLGNNLSEIIIFSRDELKQDILRKKINNEKVKFIIGDIRDKDSIKSAAKGVDYIFHAAALKQVPTCEFFPMEAVYTNIIGTENVITVALECNVKKVVVLSTDKAVYPINAMGMTKGIMEKIMIGKSLNRKNNHTILCGTRYGNVMGSRGSVIPLFIEQIKSGLPLTITDPKMTRFMMSIDNAIRLVLFAFENGKSGDIFIKKSPASTILTLAKAIKKIYNASNKIKIIGTRHGEKLYETLVNREEMTRVIDYDNYFVINADKRSLNYEKYFSKGESEISDATDYTSHNTNELDLDKMCSLLCELDFIKRDLSS